MPTRRQILLTTGAAGTAAAAAALRLHFHHPEKPPAPEARHIVVPEKLAALSALEFLTLAAATERIFPEDATPGAIALGVPLYIDGSLVVKPIPAWAESVRPGLQRLDTDAKTRFALPFHQASPSDQDAVLADLDDDDAPDKQRFFHDLVTATLEGALGDPIYGGNKNSTGWTSLGVHADMFAPSRMTR